MNINALSLVPYRVFPKCMYDLIGTDTDTPISQMQDLYSADGIFIGYNNKPATKIKGIIVNYSKGSTIELPDGVDASMAFVLLSEKNLPMQGAINSDIRTRWYIRDNDNVFYKLLSKRRKGCLLIYVCESVRGPIC